MLHLVLNCVLVTVLIVMLMMLFTGRVKTERFDNYDGLQAGPFTATPTTPPMPGVNASVFSSLPPEEAKK